MKKLKRLFYPFTPKDFAEMFIVVFVIAVFINVFILLIERHP